MRQASQAMVVRLLKVRYAAWFDSMRGQLRLVVLDSALDWGHIFSSLVEALAISFLLATRYFSLPTLSN